MLYRFVILTFFCNLFICLYRGKDLLNVRLRYSEFLKVLEVLQPYLPKRFM